MLSRRLIAPLAALVIVLATSSLVRAQTLADRVPADSIIYMGWAGVDSNPPGFAGSNFQKVLADSNIPAVIDDFIPKVLDRVAKEDKDAAQVVEIVRTVVGPMWRHPSALSFQGVAVDPNKGPMPKLLLLCQAGNESAGLKAKLEELLKMAGQPPFPVNVIQKGDLVALVVGYDKPEDAIVDAGGKSLAADPNFIASLAQVSKDGFVTFYIDTEKLFGLIDMGTAMAGGDIKANWAKAADLLGLRGVKRAIFTTGFDGKDWGARGFVAAPAPRSGFIGSLIDGKPLSDKLMQSIPANVTVAGGVHFDLAGLVSSVRKAVSAIDPNAAKEMDDGLAQVNKTVGLNIENELLGNLGQEWAYYSDPTVAGNGVVGVTGINRLKDPAAEEVALDKLEDFINRTIREQMKNEKDAPKIEIRRTTINGMTIHYLGLPLVAPAWTIQDGNLYFALYPEVVIIAAHHKAGDKSIGDNPAFATLMKRLGNHQPSTFVFTDLPRRAPDNYGSWLVISHLTGIGDLFDVPAPLQVLPPLAKLLPTLSASGQIAWADADGLHMSALTSFPGADLLASDPTSMSAAELPLMISIMLPAMNKVRGEALKAKSSSNLKNIAAGAVVFANNNNGKYPKDMGVLFETSGMTMEVFISPRGHNVPPPNLPREEQVKWVREHSDYVWNGGGRDSTMGADEPLAWEDPSLSDGGINVLFGDYHVEYQPMFQAEETIAKAKKQANVKGL